MGNTERDNYVSKFYNSTESAITAIRNAWYGYTPMQENCPQAFINEAAPPVVLGLFLFFILSQSLFNLGAVVFTICLLVGFVRGMMGISDHQMAVREANNLTGKHVGYATEFLESCYENISRTLKEATQKSMLRMAGGGNFKFIELVSQAYERTSLENSIKSYAGITEGLAQFSRPKAFGVGAFFVNASRITFIPKEAAIVSERGSILGSALGLLTSKAKSYVGEELYIDVIGAIEALVKNGAYIAEDHIIGINKCSSIDFYMRDISSIEYSSHSSGCGDIDLILGGGKNVRLRATENVRSNLLEMLRGAAESEVMGSRENREVRETPPYQLKIAGMPQTTEKICPMCAESVKQAAKICKHCRHLFTD